MSDMTVDSELVPSNPDLEAETPARPDWLPSNFTKPEDLVKSFGEAQASKTRAEQKAAALEARLEQIEAEQQQQVQAQQQYQQTNDLAARLDQARENGDTQTELALMAYVAQQAAQAIPQPQSQMLPPDFVADYASRAVAEKHDDWTEYRLKAAQYLDENSYLITDEVAGNPQLFAKRLDHAYEVVKAQALLDGTAPAAAAAQQAEAQRQAKLAAQSLQGANGRPAPVTENPFQEVMNAPVLNYRDLFR